MLTVDALKAFGADTEDAVARCMGKEDFYLMLVNKAIDDTNHEKLRDAVARKDYEAGFSAAHALKGIITNLSLTPMVRPVTEITELLRNNTDTDYSGLLDDIEAQRSKLEALR